MKIVPLSYPILLNAQKKLRFEQEEKLLTLVKKIALMRNAKFYLKKHGLVKIKTH